MKDTDIHIGLENKEIRDFLSKSITDAYQKDVDLRQIVQSGLTGYDQFIERTKINIQNLQNELEKFETFKAINKLAKNEGWDEYDVSDHVIKDSYRIICHNFFGTEEEYRKFLNINNFEEWL